MPVPNDTGPAGNYVAPAKASTPPPPPKPGTGTKTTTPTKTTKSTTTKKAAGTGSTYTAGPAPKIDAQTLAVDYGFALAVLNSNPELRTKFQQAVAQTWSVDKFTAEIRGTQWFKKTSDTARQWLILQSADPKTAAQRRSARLATLKTEAAALGVTPSAAQLNTWTQNSLMFGWTDQQLQQVMGAAWKYQPMTAQYGLAGQTIQTLKKTAADYAIPLSDSAINGWGQRVLEGLAKPEDFTNYAIQQAKSLFPTMSDALDKGITVSDYADPYRQSASQILGINPDDFNLMDPKWRESIDKVDAKTGQRAVQSIADWQTQLRTDTRYGYDSTASARQQASGLVQQLGKTFGFMG